MTHHTDAERALFEAVASDDGKWPKAIERDAKGNYLLLTTANGWMWWQAARRAPSMPDQSIIEAVDGWFARNTALGGCSDKDVAELAAIFAAAPQPPEAAPVPQFSSIAQKKLDYLLEAGEAITGYAIENKDGRRGAIDCHGFVYWWQDAAAPQQPVAAPVQLPEPQAEIEVRSMKTYLDLSIHEWRDTLSDGAYNIYTEQQVRDLLAAHGIGKDKA